MYDELLAGHILKARAALSETRPSMLGVILHFDFFVSWELLRPNLERQMSLNVFSCDYGDSGSEIGITFFTAVWRGQVCRCAESRANAPRPSPEVCRSLWPPVFFMWLPAPSPQKQQKKTFLGWMLPR